MEREKDDAPDFVKKPCRRIDCDDGGLALYLEDGTSTSLPWEKIPGAWQDDDGSLVIDLEEIVYVLPRGGEGYDALLTELPRRLRRRFTTAEEMDAEMNFLVTLFAPVAFFSPTTDRAAFARERPLMVAGWASLAFSLLGFALCALWSPALLIVEAYTGGLVLGMLWALYLAPAWARMILAALFVIAAARISEDAFRRRPPPESASVLTLNAKEISLAGAVSWPPFRFHFKETPTPYVGGLDLFLALKPGDRLKPKAYFNLDTGFLLSASKQ